MAADSIITPVVDFYSRKLQEHGAEPRGVDWPGREAQETRFEQFRRLLPGGGESFTLLDYGCGYGALLSFLTRAGYVVDYTGFDPSAAMIAAARSVHHDSAAAFTTEPPAPGATYDYIVASGIFNVKLSAPENAWREMMRGTLDRFDELSRRGFAFNVLSSRREPHRKQPHLFYGDPSELLRMCLERYSPEVALLHDYGLWDVTVLVRKIPT